MKHGSLFSGIGGFDYAAHLMGWENVMHCEINPFGRQVLKYYWPNATSYEDIKTTDFSIHRGAINILTGGFPCQPYSTAGKRLGKEDDRHLWPEMLRAIREISPRWVVGENVRGLTNWNGGLVFDEVQADLEAEGYEITPFLLPAASVGAPHRRDRILFVAHSGSDGVAWRAQDGDVQTKDEQKRGCVVGQASGYGAQRPFAYSESDRRDGARQGTEVKNGEQEPGDAGVMVGGFEGLRFQGDAADTSSTGWEKLYVSGKPDRSGYGARGYNEGNASNADSFGLRGETDRYGKAGQFDKAGTPPDWKDFPTQSPVCGRNDGISSELDGITFPRWRNESIKAYGNAIVPQVVLQIFQAIELWEIQNNSY